MLSIEPIPSTFRLLRDTLDRNNLEWVHAVEVAAGAARRRIQMLQIESPSGDASHGFYRWDGTSSSSMLAEGNERSIIVEQCRLEELIDREYGDDSVVDLLKVDTEGMEYSVLSGLGSRLAPEAIRCILFETTVGPRGLTTESRQVAALLQSHGYLIASIRQDGAIRHRPKLSWIRRPVITTLNLVAVASLEIGEPDVSPSSE